MSITTLMDYIAERARTEVTGLLNCYSAGAGDPDDAHFIPPDIDDGPVGIVMLGSSEAEAGNDETEVHSVYIRVWVPCPPEAIDWAMQQLTPFPERFKAAFRTDITQGGTATRCLYRGYDEPDVDQGWGKQYLTIDIRFEVLEKHPSHSYTAPF